MSRKKGYDKQTRELDIKLAKVFTDASGLLPPKKHERDLYRHRVEYWYEPLHWMYAHVSLLKSSEDGRLKLMSSLMAETLARMDEIKYSYASPRSIVKVFQRQFSALYRVSEPDDTEDFPVFSFNGTTYRWLDIAEDGYPIEWSKARREAMAGKHDYLFPIDKSTPDEYRTMFVTL